MLSIMTTPRATSKASIIEISKALSADVPAGIPSSSTTTWAATVGASVMSWYETRNSLLSIRDSVEYPSSLWEISDTLSSEITESFAYKLPNETKKSVNKDIAHMCFINLTSVIYDYA